VACPVEAHAPPPRGKKPAHPADSHPASKKRKTAARPHEKTPERSTKTPPHQRKRRNMRVKNLTRAEPFLEMRDMRDNARIEYVSW
jgi:hypothetical protein